MSNSTAVEKRSLNLFDIFCLGFGGAVGSGIFVLMGSGIARTGRSIVLVVGVGCIFMLLAYFYNVLLASMFMFKGGDYSQKAITFTPVFTGINAYITFVNGLSMAMYSVAMIKYASIIFPGMIPHTKLLAVVIITLFFAASIRGSKFISVLNSIMTVVLIGSILMFVTLGVPKVQPGFFSGDSFFTGGLGGFISAIAIMGWACQGTTMGPVAVSAVTKDAKKTIPAGVLLITVALIFVYGLMAYVAAGVLPVDQVANQTLSVVATEIFPRGVFVVFILGGAVFAIATSMMTNITMVRYPILKVAEDGWLPEFFTKTTKSGYPWVVYGIYYLMSVFPVLLGFSLDAMVSLVMIPAMILNGYCNFACIDIIKKHPEQWKKSILHMPTPFINLICLLSTLCAAIVCYNLFVGLGPMEMATMCGIMVACTALALFCLKKGKVSKETLETNKKAILADALQVEAEGN